MDLFEHQARKERRHEPLAQRMRPETLDLFAGQLHLLAPDQMLRRAIAQGHIPSLLLWGPPGCGKTTLAQLVARQVQAQLSILSAVNSGVKEVRETIEAAARRRDELGQRTILFIDELHRFSRTQQDALLPHVEAGTVILIGATTEHPSFSIAPALLSRLRLLQLHALTNEDIIAILQRAMSADPVLQRRALTVPLEVYEFIAQHSGGDARRALNVLELAVVSLPPDQTELTEQSIQAALREDRPVAYDKDGESHFNLTSALIKSMRGSDPDAAVYWAVRMLEGGEDPRFMLRRMVIFAAEDIGNADPQALVIAQAAANAYEYVGLPEGAIPITQAVIYMACCDKSNSSLTALQRAREAVSRYGALPVPLHLRNAATDMMKNQGYGRGYQYPHDHPQHYVKQSYLPAGLPQLSLYQPSDQGLESVLAERLSQKRERR